MKTTSFLRSILVSSLGLGFALVVACSDDPTDTTPPASDGGIITSAEAGPTPGEPAPPIFDDGGPGCGRTSQTCCAPGVKPAAWSREGEVCMPGLRCEAGLCRPTELGLACAAPTDCPSGICVPSAPDKGACSISCLDPADCTPGWSCGAAPATSGATGNVCTCTGQPEACNGKDDDCNGKIDDLGETGCGAGSRCCAGGCKSILTDPQNCGACGRDCGGGTCANGICAPVSITQAPLEYPRTYAIDAKNAYFASSDASCPGNATAYKILSCDLYNCPTPATVFTYPCGATPSFTAMATDASTGKVYWASSPAFSSGFGAVYASTGVILAALPSTPLPRILSMVVDPAKNGAPAKLYFGDAGGNVRRCTPTACADTLETLVTGQAGVVALALDDGTFYFGTRDNGTNRGIIGSCPKIGCLNGAPKVISSGEAGVFWMVADSGRVYWSARGDLPTLRDNNSVATCLDVASCTPSRQDNDNAGLGPSGLVLDREFLYWTSFANGIFKIAKTDVSTQALFLGPYANQSAGLVPLFSDGKSLVYWDGTLRRIPK